MPADLSWYDKLNQMQYSSRNRFVSESLCSQTEGSYAMIECLKNRLPVFIEYDEAGSIEFIEDALVMRLTEEGYLINIHGEERVLNPDRILRSAVRKEMLM